MTVEVRSTITFPKCGHAADRDVRVRNYPITLDKLLDRLPDA